MAAGRHRSISRARSRSWIKHEQNPRLLLRTFAIALWQKAVTKITSQDQCFRGQARRLCFDEAASSPSIAYFCAEYGVHNSLPNYSAVSGYSPAII
jgi:hypothetical protein